MVTKEKVAGGIVLPWAAMIFVWPQMTHYLVGAFYLVTFAMILSDRPGGDLFPPAAPDEDGRDMYWKLQPAWVKAFTIWIGVPAWLLFIGEMAPPFEPPNPLVLIGFAATAVLQMAFIARAFWRMDI